MSAAPTLAPSTCNCTPVIATPSVADAPTAIVPLTVALPAGEVIATANGAGAGELPPAVNVASGVAIAPPFGAHDRH